MNPEAAPEMAKRPRRYVIAMITGALSLILLAGGFILSLSGVAADWIGWLGIILTPVATTVLALGIAGPMDPSLPPPHPLQVLNNCQ